MPYKAKGKCVYKADTGKKVGCTKGSVKKYLAALHANVPDAKHEEIENPMKRIKLSEIAKKMIQENRPAPLMLNGKEVERGSLEIDGVDPKDYPDFSDAYIAAGNFVDGTPLTDEEIAQLEDENYGLSNELAHGRYLEEGEQQKREEPSKQPEDRFEWENDPYHSRRFEKSDVSWREYDQKMNPQNYR